MLLDALKHIRTALSLLVFFILVTGLLYPYAVTGLAQLLFPWEANGSLIKVNDKNVGSALIGQAFSSNYYFWGRPSATSPFPYNAASSSGSNMGPSNPDFLASVKTRALTLQLTNTSTTELIPVDLVTASGSGLDPHISPLAAYYQIPRIAKARNVAPETIHSLVDQHLEQPTLFMLGASRINVLQLNLALDQLHKSP